MKDETIRKATGRTWAEWTRVLDRAGAHAWPHRQIADFVHTTHGVPGWWTQTVTVGYERIKGLREKGQRRGGGYEANKSKTIAASAARITRAFTDRQKAYWTERLDALAGLV
jgi:hypothetical protein